MADYEEEARRLSESRIDPARVLGDRKPRTVAAITAWVSGWLMASRELAAREHHDPGDEDRSE